MARWRRRRVTRNALVFLGSLIAHVGVFLLAAQEFTFYPPAEEYLPPVELQIVPREPAPQPFVRPLHEKRAPQPTSAPPAAQLPKPTPQPPAPVQAPPKPVISATAPTLVPHRQAPSAVERAKLAPQALAPALSSEVEGPPKAAPRSTVQTVQAQTAAQPHIVLHRAREAEGQSLAPSINIPGAIMAPSAEATRSAPPGGAPAGAAAGGGGAPGGAAGGSAAAGLPTGLLPGFGPGLRGSLIGCANAEVLHLSPAERARCAEAFGEGARESPVMDPIAARRPELNHEAASESAAERYRDSTPSGSAVRTIDGQPRLFHKPGDQ